MKLGNSVVLVTGGAHGIGRALCRAFHLEGARVAVADLDIKAAEKVAAEVGGLALQTDVSREDEIIAAIEKNKVPLSPLPLVEAPLQSSCPNSNLGIIFLLFFWAIRH